ncbi:MAG: glutamate--tRNA ligase [Gemmatimonadales bacterium]|nr:glutamate--tRNA ligase [Gemmatimonadales bacterium]MDZ4389425.1 glutamate--tRNA ligase [Gemmatimonadales bacterium]
MTSDIPPIPAPRVRFAPSPTGYLHVGGARTALFNWLYARQTGGTFVLRIEDTDKERSTEAHTQVILDGMSWLGLDWDEGPLFQGEYADRHRADAERLLAEGKAYRDYLTAQELDGWREQAKAAKIPFRFNRQAMALSADEVARRQAAGAPYAIRFAVPDEEIAWTDAVHGRISWQGRDLDDFIILRSDGSAIYNLAVVSDDIAMAITHVIRGDDHVSNTPKQIALYRALGQEPPVFAHVPMILGTDGKKLSKRHGATAVGDYQDQGILPAAMRNFLALLGWSPGNDDEIVTMEEMIARFSLEAIQSKPAVFDPAKLEWMNGQYLSMLPAIELHDPVVRQLERMGVNWHDAALDPIIDAVKARARTVTSVAEQVATRLPGATVVRDAKGEALVAKMGEQFTTCLALARAALAAVPPGDWQLAPLEAALKETAEREGLKLGDVMQPVRVALTGGTVSEPVNELLAVVGREESLRRMR